MRTLSTVQAFIFRDHRVISILFYYKTLFTVVYRTSVVDLVDESCAIQWLPSRVHNGGHLLQVIFIAHHACTSNLLRVTDWNYIVT